MQKKAPANVLELRVARREKEVNVKSIAKKLKVRWRKSRERENPRPDVTRRNIEYFMLKPKAKAPHYLQPGEIVGVKVGDEWVNTGTRRRRPQKDTQITGAELTCVEAKMKKLIQTNGHKIREAGFQEPG